ncbi:hypothetical protein ACI2LJ_08800 [Streptomyces sp. NPDC088090]|uniref:hypothetical protein n=1 Tax=Streptomyces sp. NPDC088090 TaxID=3365822 RepID=UPI00385037DC
MATALGWPAVSRDEIKKQMAAAGADPADPAVDLRTWEAFLRAIGGLVRSGTSLVAEAAFQDRLWCPGLERSRAWRTSASSAAPSIPKSPESTSPAGPPKSPHAPSMPTPTF